jgi:hypothetical protein
MENKKSKISEENAKKAEISEENLKIAEENAKIAEENAKRAEENAKIAEENAKLAEENEKQHLRSEKIVDIWNKHSGEFGQYMFIPHVEGVSMDGEMDNLSVLIFYSEGLDKNKIPDKIAGYPVKLQLTMGFFAN